MTTENEPIPTDHGEEPQPEHSTEPSHSATNVNDIGFIQGGDGDDPDTIPGPDSRSTNVIQQPNEQASDGNLGYASLRDLLIAETKIELGDKPDIYLSPGTFSILHRHYREARKDKRNTTKQEQLEELAETRILQQLDYAELMEDRMRRVEKRLAALEAEGNVEPENNDEDTQSVTSEKSPVVPRVNPVPWANFKLDLSLTPQEICAIDVLVEEPIIIRKSDRLGRPIASVAPGLPKQEASLALESEGQEKKEASASSTTRVSAFPERIRINSIPIIRILEKIHGATLTDDDSPVLIYRPFRPLVFYETEIRDWLDNLKVRWGEEEPTVQGSQSLEHDAQLDTSESQQAFMDLRCLVGFLDEYISPRVQFIRGNNCQKIFFEDVWHLFRPGDIVMTSANRRQAYQVYKVTGPQHRPTIVDAGRPTVPGWVRPNPVRIYCVYIDYDGRFLGPVREQFEIAQYEGERDITSLPVFPIRFARETDLRQTLIAQGKLFLDVCAVRNMHCTGVALESQNEIDSQVVIDIEEAIVKNKAWAPEIQELLGDDNEIKDEDDETFPNCIEECCANETSYTGLHVNKARRDNFVRGGSRSQVTGFPSPAVSLCRLRDTTGSNTLSEEELMLLPHRVFAFVLRSRRWEKLELSTIREITRANDDPFNLLVLPEGHKEMVKSLITQHFQEKEVTHEADDQVDLVRGKGKGLILLLHGAPGVGKTSTAECVADSFARPLFPITCGDLGTTAAEVENSLETNFTLANRWGCILLLDEADVFLQARSRQDFQRNSLVSVFLRVLEYYAGILFLTTNRVGLFDEAFKSRIHISLYYPPLDKKSTIKIWKMHLDRTEKRQIYAPSPQGKGDVKYQFDVKREEIIAFAKRHFRDNEDARWNGRQIRNAFQTAIAIAKHGARSGQRSDSGATAGFVPVVLDASHFDIVAKASRAFDDYINDVYHGMTTSKRVYDLFLRSDQWGMPEEANPMNTRFSKPGPKHPAQMHNSSRPAYGAFPGGRDGYGDQYSASIDRQIPYYPNQGHHERYAELSPRRAKKGRKPEPEPEPRDESASDDDTDDD